MMTTATAARVLCFAGLLVAPVILLAARQQPGVPVPVQPRDAPARATPSKGTAVIRGTVTSSGRPLADARVMISGGEPGGTTTATTDDEGRFAAAQLPAGRYTVTVAKAGYINLAWGQRQARGMGRPIYLAGGETRQIAVELPRAGVITGTVFDERGGPLIGVSVQASVFATTNGQRMPRPIGGATTDDRGVYRVHSLQPGEYMICAADSNPGPSTNRHRLQQELDMLRRTMSSARVPISMTEAQIKQRVATLEAQLADAGAEPMRGFAPACVGGAGAGLALATSEERTAVDLHLPRVSLGWLEGMVVLPAGVSARDVQIILSRLGDVMPGFINTGVGLDDDGRFTRDALIPGEYRVDVRTRVMDWRGPGPPGVRVPRSQGAPSPPTMWAAADITVDSRGTTGVVIELQPAGTVSGEIVFEGTSPRPSDLSRIQVMVSPHRPPMAMFGRTMAEMAQGAADASGRFTIPGVIPGSSYRVGANIQGWYLKSATLGDRDLLDAPLDVTAGDVSGVTLTFTDRPTELSATVIDSKGQPAMEHSLVLFAADDRYWTPGSRRLRVARAMPDGTFVFRGVPAGEYRVAALLDFDQGELGSREFLEQLAWSSTRVTLGDGETKRVSLRVQAE